MLALNVTSYEANMLLRLVLLSLFPPYQEAGGSAWAIGKFLRGCLPVVALGVP